MDHRIVGQIKRRPAARSGTIQVHLPTRAFVAAVLVVAVRLAVRIGDPEAQPPRKAAFQLRLQAMIVLVGIGIEREDAPQRLNALRGHRRIEELLNRPPRLEVRVARWQCAVEVFAGIGRVRGLASHVPNRQRHRPGEFALHVEAPLPDIPLLAVRFQPPDADWRPCQRTRVVSPNRRN